MSFTAFLDGERLIWQWPGCRLELRSGRPLIAGILNITPDSFSDGGLYYPAARPPEEEGALAGSAEIVAAGVNGGVELARQGARIIDVGGQSTRPGYTPVAPEEELRRVMPVLEGLKALLPPEIAVSLDTDKPAVAEAVLSRGLAHILNDESGGSRAMACIAARYKTPVILMHRPAGDGRGALEAVLEDLRQLRLQYIGAGCHPMGIALDPGLGFGKTAQENLKILARTGDLHKLGAPIYIGASRKSFIGLVTGVQEARSRQGGSVGAALWAAEGGAHFLRVHDVGETAGALNVYCLLKELAAKTPEDRQLREITGQERPD